MITKVSSLAIGDGGNSAAYSGAGSLTLATMIKGDIAVVDAANAVVAAGTIPSAFRVAYGLGPAQFRLTDLITRGRVVGYLGENYTAPVAKVITLSAIVTDAASVEYFLRVVVKDDTRMQQNRQTGSQVSFVAPAGATATAVATGLVAAIARDRYLSSMVTAAVSGSNITLTGRAVPSNTIDKYQYVDFTASLVIRTGLSVTQERLAATETVTTALVPGNGLSQQIFDLEKEVNGWLGARNLIAFPVVGPASNVVAGANYDIIHIDFQVEAEGSHDKMASYPQRLTIAVPTGSAQRTDLLAVLNPIMAAYGFATIA